MAIRTRIVPFEASLYKEFRIKMRVAENPHGMNHSKGTEKLKLLWGTAELPVFSSDFVISDKPVCSLPVIIDGQWHEYLLPVGENPYWKGKVDELWFDPANLSFAYVDIALMEFV